MTISQIYQPLYAWFLSHGIRILFIILGSVFLYILLKKFSKKIIQLVLEQTSCIIKAEKKINQKRLETISNIFISTGFVTILTISIVMILSELGFNVAPIIAGAGIFALAIGIGCQSLLRDLISGMFILIENQYDIGDRINIGSIAGTNVEGVVKMINLRRTTITDDNGNTHIVPNGSISLVTRINESVTDN